MVTEKSSPGLYWQWNDLDNLSISNEFVYAIFLTTISVLSLQLFYPINIFLFAINIFTFFFSKYSYKNTEIGRMWCRIAAYIPLILIVFELNS